MSIKHESDLFLGVDTHRTIIEKLLDKISEEGCTFSQYDAESLTEHALSLAEISGIDSTRRPVVARLAADRAIAIACDIEDIRNLIITGDF